MCDRIQELIAAIDSKINDATTEPELIGYYAALGVQVSGMCTACKLLK